MKTKKLISAVLCLSLLAALAAVPAQAADKTLTLREDWRLTSDLDLAVPEGDTLTIDGGGHYIYELGGKLLNSGLGTVTFTNGTILYPEGDSGACTTETSNALMAQRQPHVITIDAGILRGTVTAQSTGTTAAGAATAKKGDEVTLTITPQKGYEMKGLTVTDAEGTEVPVTDDKFTMPASAVTVSATFSSTGVNAVTGISLDKPSAALKVGGTESLTATIEPSNAIDQEIIWRSSDETIATVDDNGKVTAAGPGTAAITVTTADGGFTATCTVTVTRPSSSGSSGPLVYGVAITPAENGRVTPSETSAAKGAKITLTVKPDEGYKLDKLTATNSSGEDVALTDNGDGTYTFILPAMKVTVTASFVQDSDEPEPSPRSFSDVPEGAWYYDAVYHCADSGYFQGVDDTHFIPDGTMTRAMFATVLYRIEGEPAVTGESPFSDVEAGKWYTDPVIWAAEQKIIDGYGNGRFGTDDPVTREQMVTLFWRCQGRPAVGDTDLSAFTDAGQISDWAKDAFAWAVGAGILNGKGGGILDPKGSATRAEVAQIVMNFDTKVG